MADSSEPTLFARHVNRKEMSICQKSVTSDWGGATN
jgi:hypothetical protein